MSGRCLFSWACALLLVSGCGSSEPPTGVDAPGPTPATAAVNEFVASQGLPLFHWTHQIVMRDGYECFGVSFGPGQDCPAGCFYSWAYGIRVGERVGWLGFENAWDFAPPPESCFDVLPTDAILFDFDTWLAISDADWSTAWNGLVPLLARDPDTARAALLNIATILYTHHSRLLALDLVNNPAVATDVEILTLLSELPVVGAYDLYSEARSIALGLLGSAAPPGLGSE